MPVQQLPQIAVSTCFGFRLAQRRQCLGRIGPKQLSMVVSANRCNHHIKFASIPVLLQLLTPPTGLFYAIYSVRRILLVIMHLNVISVSSSTSASFALFCKATSSAFSSKYYSLFQLTYFFMILNECLGIEVITLSIEGLIQ